MPTVTKGPKTTQAAVEPLAASTTIIPSMTTICGMTPTAASMALSNAANGPIQDIIGNNGLALNHFKEAARSARHLVRVSDAADPNLTLLNGVYNTLIGSGSPTSTNLLASMDQIIANGQTPATTVLCNVAAGPITDYLGQCVGLSIMFKEARAILVLVYRDIDASDPIKPMLSDILLTLASTGTLMAAKDWLESIGPIYDVPPVALEPTSGSFTAAGGMSSFTVTMTGPGVSRSWTVDKDAGAVWLTLNTPPLHEPQMEDGAVTYAVDSSLGTVPRTAHFYINGKTYTVTQAGT